MEEYSDCLQNFVTMLGQGDRQFVYQLDKAAAMMQLAKELHRQSFIMAHKNEDGTLSKPYERCKVPMKFRHTTEILKAIEERRAVDSLAMVPQLFKKVSFMGILTLHNQIEVSSMEMQQKLDTIEEGWLRDHEAREEEWLKEKEQMKEELQAMEECLSQLEQGRSG